MYNILSVQTYIILNICLTAGKQNGCLFQQYCFYYGGKNLFQKSFVKKRKTTQRFEKVLLVWTRNVELLRLVGATFDFKVSCLTGMRKKNLIILKSLPFFCLSLLTFELSNIN